MRRLLAILVLALCGWPAAAGALTVTDQTGRSLVLPAAPARIISLVPSVTEILFTIGAQDRLVGVTDFCDFPPAARRKPSVGGMLAPSLEGMVALKPDLVVATTAGNRHETFDQLRHERAAGRHDERVGPEHVEHARPGPARHAIGHGLDPLAQGGHDPVRGPGVGG